jgi:hypothetical protein
MNKTNPKTTQVDCFQCRYFYTTWEASEPRGCKAFGFKTSQMPSKVVVESSGEPCLKFSPKNTPSPHSKNIKGWIA